MTDSKFRQLPNTESVNSVISGGRVIDTSPDDANAAVPIDSRVFGNVIEVKEVHPPNVSLPIVANPNEMLTELKLEHCANKLSDNTVTVGGTEKVIIPVFANVEVPIDDTLSGKVTLVRFVHPWNT